MDAPHRYVWQVGISSRCHRSSSGTFVPTGTEKKGARAMTTADKVRTHFVNIGGFASIDAMKSAAADANAKAVLEPSGR
jgi:hypothetical protein